MGFVKFESVEQLKNAVEVSFVCYCLVLLPLKFCNELLTHVRVLMRQELEGISIGNKTLKVANVVPRSFDKNIKSPMTLSGNAKQTSESAVPGELAEALASSNGHEDGNGNDEGLAGDGSGLKVKSARDVVTPLAHMSYSDQLEHKKNSIAQMLKKLVRIANLCFAFHFL